MTPEATAVMLLRRARINRFKADICVLIPCCPLYLPNSNAFQNSICDITPFTTYSGIVNTVYHGLMETGEHVNFCRSTVFTL